MAYTTLTLGTEGPIAELRLDRPDETNPIDMRLLAELDDAAARIHDAEGVAVALLTSTGDMFSHGWRDSEPRMPADAFRCLELMPQPVIAVIQGDATGAGLELALACDIRLAAEGVMFALPDVAMGMMPSGGATQRLPRLIGRGRASEMILMGEPVSARQALDWGLVNEVAPRGDVGQRARRLAEAIAARGPLAVRYAKEAVLRGLDMPLDQALRYETDLTVILQTTADRAEGVRAFLDKRAPRFEGR